MTDAPSSAGTPSSNRNVMLVLAYFGPLALVPFLVEKNDPEVQWHAKHGLVLLAAKIILSVALSVVGMVVGQIPGLGCLVALIGFLFSFGLGLGVVILHVVMIIKAINGQRLLIPGVSEYVNRF